MPRTARKKSKSGIYHIMLRGINRQTIFEDEEDRFKFIDTLRHYKQECEYNIFAYCLMDNHIHLVIKEGKDPLEKLMKRIGVSYVYWYNWKYKRSGHLFQDRYKSEVIEDDRYLLEVIRYIHQNPLQAEMITSLGEYRWSSYAEYTWQHSNIVDTNFILEMFSRNNETARELFIEYMGRMSDCEKEFNLERTKRLTDEEAKEIIKNAIGNLATTQLQSMAKDKRDDLLRKLKAIEGLSIRQIARITGLNFNVVAKA
ncbi:transposase [Sporomusa malonica]